jgi:hypothetical protein
MGEKGNTSARYFQKPLVYPSLSYKIERAKTGLLGIRIMCQSGATCLSADCCFYDLAL